MSPASRRRKGMPMRRHSPRAIRGAPRRHTPSVRPEPRVKVSPFRGRLPGLGVTQHLFHVNGAGLDALPFLGASTSKPLFLCGLPRRGRCSEFQCCLRASFSAVTRRAPPPPPPPPPLRGVAPTGHRASSTVTSWDPKGSVPG